MAKHGDKIAPGLRKFGEGKQVGKIPTHATIRYKDFSGGYFAADAEEEAPANCTPGGVDMEVTRKDRIIRAPGTSAVEALAPKTPSQLAIHAGLDFRSELILFDAPYVGIKREAATNWINVLPLEVDKGNFFWATYGEEFYFSCGTERVFKHTFGENTVVASTLTTGKSFAVFAGRMWVLGALIGGDLEPLGIVWSGVNGAEDTSVDTGYGFEYLIQDAGMGDAGVALRPMGFDLMAVLMRRSIWVARRTGDLERPADFMPRVTGKGCAAERTARTVHGGVIYLSDEGLELFDGNESKHISDAIDSEILPLDMSKIDRYASGYNPHTQRYYLLVPDVGVYVLDIQRNRWYKRTQLADDVVPFAEQFHSVSWAEAIGTWPADVDETTWADMSPTESSPPNMVFLGSKEDDSVHLEKEDPASGTYFGRPQTPLWITPVLQQDADLGLFTSRESRITYVGAGVVGIYMKNIEGQLIKVSEVTLPGSSTIVTRKSNKVHTGQGAGLGVSILSGEIEISRLELEVRVRGRRIDTVTDSVDAPPPAPEPYTPPPAGVLGSGNPYKLAMFTDDDPDTIGNSDASQDEGGLRFVFGRLAQALAQALHAVVMGDSAEARGDYCVAIGSAAVAGNAAESDAIAIGRSAIADDVGAIAIGRAAGATEDKSIAIGYQSSAGFAASMAFGDHAVAQHANEAVFGGTDEGTGRLNYVSRFRVIPALGLPVKHMMLDTGWAVAREIIDGQPDPYFFVDGNGSVHALRPGQGFRTKEGANCRQGVAVLVAGTVVVNTNIITANSRIFLTPQNGGSVGAVGVSARVVGVSFTILSSDAADTRTIAYEIFEPSA